jgi:hypothetical protein
MWVAEHSNVLACWVVGNLSWREHLLNPDGRVRKFSTEEKAHAEAERQNRTDRRR